MWIALFTVAIAFAVLLSVAAFAMRDRDKIGINPMRFFSEKVPLETELVASPKFLGETQSYKFLLNLPNPNPGFQYRERQEPRWF